MSSRDEATLAQAQRLGVPPDMLAQARNNPAMLAFLREKLESLSMSSPSPPPMGQFTETDPDGIARYLDAAKAKFEQDKKRPVRKPPAGNRRENIDGANAHHDSMLRQKDMHQVLMSMTCVPKSFADKPFSELRRSKLLSFPSPIELY
jgi:hypothetical protein